MEPDGRERRLRRPLLDAGDGGGARRRQPGYSSLEFRLADTTTAAANRTVDDVRGYLRANTSFTGFSDLPSIRKPGTYPGKELFDQLASLMNVFTVLALLAAAVLIANTMTTLIGEQRREIGMMKAIGGTRRQIRRVYLRTALLLGAIAAVIGVVLGVVIANAIVRLLRLDLLRDLARLRAISVPVVVASIVLGLVAPPLAALPAIRRGTRIPVREGLEEVPALQGGARSSTGAPAPSPSCRARRRSASAASPAAHDAASRPSPRSRSPSGRCWRARADQQRHDDDERRLEPARTTTST